MATHDYIISDQTGISFLSDLNAALSAIVSQNSSTTAPTTTYAGMFWYDTSGASGILKQRNKANDAWVTIYDPSAGIVYTSGNQTIAGLKTFSSDGKFNNLTVGKGNGSLTANTALGETALAASTSGSANVAVGYQTLSVGTEISQNTAVGAYALKNTTGSYNTGVGYQSLTALTIGLQNTAVGAEAGTAMLNGSGNSFFGYRAGYSLTSSTGNTLIGSNAGSSVVTGVANIAVGSSAFSLGTGSYNVAIGPEAVKNATGQRNVGVGLWSLANCTSGINNTAIGGYSGSGVTTGSGNVILTGMTSSDAISPVYNVTTENNRVVVGTTAVTNAYIQVAWTVVSDARDKTNFQEVPHGLEFVSKLKPISYQFKYSRDDDTPNGKVRYGFKAQDILEIEGETPVIIDNEDMDKLKYDESSLIPVLVKAIQELKQEVDTLKCKLSQ